MKTLRATILLCSLAWLFDSSPMMGKLVCVDKGNGELMQSGKYLHYRGQPFEGVLTEKHDFSGIKSQAHYSRGLADGKATTWYADGNKESERYYDRGEKHGLHVGWWPDGKPRFEYHFASGLYHGTFKEWYASGKPMHAFEYTRGNEVKAVGWRENGKTYINLAVRGGKKYGLTNSRLCYSLVDEQGIYQSSKN